MKRERIELILENKKVADGAIEIVVEKEQIILDLKNQVAKKEEEYNQEIKNLNQCLNNLNFPMDETKEKLKQFMVMNKRLNEKISFLENSIEEKNLEYESKLIEYSKYHDKDLNNRYNEIKQFYSKYEANECQNCSSIIENLKVFYFLY